MGVGWGTYVACVPYIQKCPMSAAGILHDHRPVHMCNSQAAGAASITLASHLPCRGIYSSHDSHLVWGLLLHAKGGCSRVALQGLYWHHDARG